MALVLQSAERGYQPVTEPKSGRNEAALNYPLSTTQGRGNHEEAFRARELHARAFCGLRCRVTALEPLREPRAEAQGRSGGVARHGRSRERRADLRMPGTPGSGRQ